MFIVPVTTRLFVGMGGASFHVVENATWQRMPRMVSWSREWLPTDSQQKVEISVLRLYGTELCQPPEGFKEDQEPQKSH